MAIKKPDVRVPSQPHPQTPPPPAELSPEDERKRQENSPRCADRSEHQLGRGHNRPWRRCASSCSTATAGSANSAANPSIQP